MADELIDVCDGDAKPTGIRKMKSEVHKQGLWHRTAHVWIYNSEGELLLQLRAKDKIFWPDKWDLSAAGHIGAGEEPEEAAIREVKEELGLQPSGSDLELFRVQKQQTRFNGLENNEHTFVYLLKFRWSIGDLKMQKEEVQDLRFFRIADLEKEIRTNPDKYVLQPDSKYWEAVLERIKQKIRPPASLH